MATDWTFFDLSIRYEHCESMSKTAETASCPRRVGAILFSRWTRRKPRFLFFSICFNGIQVHCDTTSAMSSSVIAAREFRLAPTSTFWRSFSSLPICVNELLLRMPASSFLLSEFLLLASSFWRGEFTTLVIQTAFAAVLPSNRWLYLVIYETQYNER